MVEKESNCRFSRVDDHMPYQGLVWNRESIVESANEWTSMMNSILCNGSNISIHIPQHSNGITCWYTAAWCCRAMSRHFGHLWTKCLQLEPTGLKSEVADVAGWSGWRWWPVCWLRDISFDWLWRARGPHLRHFFSRHVTNDRQSDTVALCVPEDLIGWLDC